MSYNWKERDPAGYERWASGYGFLETDVRVFHINTPEDYSEYRADKGLHDAYQNRVNVPTIDQLVRMWVEHERAVDVITPPNSKENSDDHS